MQRRPWYKHTNKSDITRRTTGWHQWCHHLLLWYCGLCLRSECWQHCCHWHAGSGRQGQKCGPVREIETCQWWQPSYAIKKYWSNQTTISNTIQLIKRHQVTANSYIFLLIVSLMWATICVYQHSCYISKATAYHAY